MHYIKAYLKKSPQKRATVINAFLTWSMFLISSYNRLQQQPRFLNISDVTTAARCEALKVGEITFRVDYSLPSNRIRRLKKKDDKTCTGLNCQNRVSSN